MRVIKIYNKRKVWGGEDIVVDTITDILIQRGEYVHLWTRDNLELGKGLIGKIRAFIWGIYSPAASRMMTRLIQKECPDVVHAHNLYPLFSPSVLIACRRAGVPVVIHCHSYYLTCPITFHFQDGNICERCYGGRNYFCILKNCRGNIFESLGYALRNTVIQKLRLFRDNVTLFITLTEFSRNWLILAGFNKNQIVTIPNMVSVPNPAADASCGKYVAYVGRLNPEKGVNTLLSASAYLTKLPIRIAGDGPLMKQLADKSSTNVKFVGWLDQTQLEGFYRKARFVVVPSKCFETFCLVAAEAMAYGLPIIASKIGGLPELVEDGVTGFLFEPGNFKDLSSKMKLLWENPYLCRRMGQAGREKAMREYSKEVYYKRLMEIYRNAIALNNSKLK